MKTLSSDTDHRPLATDPPPPSAISHQPSAISHQPSAPNHQPSSPPPGRYIRQTAVPCFGEAGQEALSRLTVAIVGCGALGSMQAELLVRMGVGALRIADGDTVAEMNLHRQIQFTEADAAAKRNKAEAGAARLRTLNGACRIEAVTEFVTPATIGAFIAGAGVVLDATDSVPVRYLINDAAVAAGIPWVYCGVSGTAGQVLAVVPGRGPCLRCLFPEPPAPESVPSAVRGGVLPPTVAALVALQVTAALRRVTGDLPAGRLIRCDVWEPALRTVAVARNPACPCCGAAGA